VVKYLVNQGDTLEEWTKRGIVLALEKALKGQEVLLIVPQFHNIDGSPLSRVLPKAQFPGLYRGNRVFAMEDFILRLYSEQTVPSNLWNRVVVGLWLAPSTLQKLEVSNPAILIGVPNFSSELDGWGAGATVIS